MTLWRVALDFLSLLQAAAGARVLWRLLRSRGGVRIPARTAGAGDHGAVSVVVPVLDERERLGPCLDGLLAQGLAVAELLVVDGGSRDGTPDLVRRYAGLDPRLRLVDASPIPPGRMCVRRLASSPRCWRSQRRARCRRSAWRRVRSCAA